MINQTTKSAIQQKQTLVEQPSFTIQQFFTPCISEFAYYIESDHQVAIIDPLRDISPYVELAQQNQANIVYVFETHFHADFVSGHYELAQTTGAKIVFGPTAKPNFSYIQAKDQEVFQVGKIKIKVIHTPGHTLESSSYLLIDENDKIYSVFTGDTLFLNEVGRPDLAVSADISSKDLAGYLYDSLRQKLMTLPDETILYPGHGAGSSCGKSIGAGMFCTIGIQKKNNYALQEMTKEQFQDLITKEIANPPRYFFYDAQRNKEQLESTQEILQKALTELSIEEAQKYYKDFNNYQFLDSRDNIADGIISGSFNIPLRSPFVTWVGQILDPKKRTVVIADEGKETETAERLCRIGFDNIVGYLKGGIQSWKNNNGLILVPYIYNVEDIIKKINNNDTIIDIRTNPEIEKGYVKGSQLIPFQQIIAGSQQLKENNLTFYCGTGARAQMCFAFLASKGLRELGYCSKGYQDIVNAQPDLKAQ